ncbi:hypothetical protein AB0B28_06530 [Glycomyces sp. NPDC046736]|uniref:hypothetical protein n=1 Tax=Glycomyces sp. NPDC046736 TaxID=3155615 RepID=UPI00340E0CDE
MGTRRIADRDFTFTVYSPALVTVTDPEVQHRFVANITVLPRSGTTVLYHSWTYREVFGVDRSDPAGRSAREALIAAALEVRDTPPPGD